MGFSPPLKGCHRSGFRALMIANATKAARKITSAITRSCHRALTNSHICRHCRATTIPERAATTAMPNKITASEKSIRPRLTTIQAR